MSAFTDIDENVIRGLAHDVKYRKFFMSEVAKIGQKNRMKNTTPERRKEISVAANEAKRIKNVKARSSQRI